MGTSVLGGRADGIGRWVGELGDWRGGGVAPGGMPLFLGLAPIQSTAGRDTCSLVQSLKDTSSPASQAQASG